MSIHYESVQIDSLYPEAFHVTAPLSHLGRYVRPCQSGVFIRQGAPRVERAIIPESPSDEPSAVAHCSRELIVGQFGLVPRWVKSASDAKLRIKQTPQCTFRNRDKDF